MKRALFFLFFLLSVYCSKAQDILVGDMNGDGKLTVTDVATLVDALVNKTERKHVYSAESFIKENALTGDFLINGKKVRYENGIPDPYNGYEYVDLGLSVKWAKKNVGSSTEYGTGKRFSWGETTSRDYYFWDAYDLCNGTSDVMNRYCTDADYGEVDNISCLSSDDDAASANLGGKWRMPTQTEYEELLNNCYMIHTLDYDGSYTDGYIVYKAKSKLDKGIVGKNVSSETYTLNDPHIFLPASGYKSNQIFGGGVRGYYWTSSLYKPMPNSVHIIYFYPGEIKSDYFGRCFGLPIRAVCP